MTNRQPIEYKEGVDYLFIDYNHADGESITAIKILSGNFKDVVYHYGTVKVKKLEEDSQPLLQFDYRLLSPGNHDETQLHSNQEYVTMMGDILTSIMIQQLGEIDATNRTNDSEELDS